MAESKHLVALVGAGRIGAIHAANVAAHARLHLAYVVDPDAAAASLLATRHGAGVASLETVLSDPRVAAVIIASPTDAHVDHTLAAAQAGKVVLCEKPLDLDLARATRTAAHLSTLGARVVMAFNRRFDPDFTALHRRLGDGAIGVLETLHITSHDPAPPPLAYIRHSGGLFRDMVIHDFDMARWLLGEEPVAVFATASCLVDPAIGAAGDMDTARTVLRTASGRLCTISSSRRSGYGYDQRIEAYGAGGRLAVNNRAAGLLEAWGGEGTTTDRFQTFFLDRYAAAYAAEMAHLAAVIDGAAPAITPADAVAALALAEAAVRSVASGRMEPVQPA